LKFSKQADWFEALEASGVKDIAPIASKPNLFADLELDYSAFHILNASRTAGFSGPDSLQLTEILAFMEMFKIQSVTERRTLLKRIRILDREFMKFFSEQQELKKEEKKKDKKSGKQIPDRSSGR
jgi:hypothetical protein